MKAKETFKEYSLKTPIKIDSLISFLYYDIAKDYCFNGEKHNFWELIYVDYGNLFIKRDDQEYAISKGKILLHPPNEFHGIRGNGESSARVLIVSFKSSSMDLLELSQKIFTVTKGQARLIKELYTSADEAFQDCGVKHGMLRLSEKENQLYGAEQFVKIYIEALFLSLIRTHRQKHIAIRRNEVNTKLSSGEMEQLEQYLVNNLGENLTLDVTEKATGISKRKIQYLVKDNLNMTITNYIRGLRIEKAKELLRDKKLTITEIAECVGYSSIHYFSSQFKKECGITPTEYARTLKYKGHGLSYSKET